MNLQHLFEPRSIAIIGASNDKNKVGYALVSNLLNGGKRDIYPVSITEKNILGLQAYPSVKNIEGEVDLALIAVRADIVPSILEDCGAKKISTVIVIAAGFKEIGPTGAELEKRVTEIAKKHGITLLGPNCLGTIDTHADLNASFANGKPRKGSIAFLSQSGALGTAVLDKALAEGVGISKFISLGNEAALTEIEFLEYLRHDKDTKSILMYVEQMTNGPTFMKLASEITKHKPIVLIKAGRGARGQQAVMSHTGSLAPEDAILTAACRQSGVIVVESIREFFNMAKLFELGVTKPLQNLIILTNAGGPAVITADQVELSRSLSLVELSDETKNALRKVLPPMAAVNNPVDIIGDALSTRYEAALKILIDVSDADAIITLLTPQMMTEAEATAKLLVEYNKRKPIIPVFIGGESIMKGVEVLHTAGMVNFTFPKDAVEALDNLARGSAKIGATGLGETKVSNSGAGTPSKSGTTVECSRPNTNSSGALTMMSYKDMSKLFREYDLNLPGILVHEKNDLADAMKKAGAKPYTLKAMSPDVIHKTDMGAVKLHLNNVTDLETAWDEIVSSVKSKKPQAIIEGMLFQIMSPGKEIIVGMKRDATFGPTILFGLGGIFTEALKDTSLRIAPISKETALEMIHQIRGIDILTGIRGEEPINFSKLSDIIVKISKLAVAHPEIKEIDLNPVMVRPDGADIVDARVMI